MRARRHALGLALVFVSLLGARFTVRHRARAVQRIVAVAILLLTLSVTAWGFARASKLPFLRAQAISQVFDFSTELPF